MSEVVQQTLAPATAASLAEFARSCKAAARAVSLYPGQHPAIGTSLGRLTEATARLTTDGPLELQVRPDTLLIGNAAAPKADASIQELAALLNRHLIGVMIVNAGVDPDSWRTLLLLLSRTPEEVQADGGIANLWSKTGGPSIELREIDYAEVLREKEGSLASLDDIIAAALEGTPLEIDDDGLDKLLAMLADPAQLDEIMARLDQAAKVRGGDTKAAAVMQLLQTIADRVRHLDPERVESAFKQLGKMTGRLSADDMVRLITHQEADAQAGGAVKDVLQRMEDADVAHFVAESVIAEQGASERLMHAFHALVPDIERRRRLLALAHDEVAESPMIEEATPEELWGRVESMVSSYSDTKFVSEEYGRELWHAQKRIVGVEETGDDPPERVAFWLATVNDAALRGLDHQVLTDLLSLEADPNRWRDVAETAASHAEDLVRVEQFEHAWSLADAVVRYADGHPQRQAHLPKVLEGFASAPIMKRLAQQLRHAGEDTVGRFERLCHAIGTPVIAPLAEALSTEHDARSRRRLRDLLVGFGAQGRDAVQQLMHAPNWEVRRTAAFLLREFGGAEGLRELIPLLVDNEPLVQREAVHGLVLNGSDEAGRILLEALGKVSGRARQTLVAELSNVKDRRASPVLAYLVRHLNRARHPQVYLSAIEALGTFGDPEAVDALKGALHAGDWWSPVRTRNTRAAAAASLRRIGTPEAVGALKAASQNGSRGTRAAARAELTHLGEAGG
jgi:hypothetical protein